MSWKPELDKEGHFKIKTESFSSKTVTVGGVEKSLYKRIHGNNFFVANNQSTSCDFVIPYPHVKIEGIEILSAHPADDLNLKVLDADGNVYSGLDVGTYGDNFMLNQFAFNVHPATDYYRHDSQYDADLYQGMIIRIEYNNTGSGKNVYMNFLLNEVK